MTILDPQLASSTEFIEAAITYKVAGQFTDPTGFTGHMAFKTTRDDEPGDDFTAPEWHAATWVSAAAKPTLATKLGPKYGGVVLARGLWHVFVGLDDGATSAPVFYVGTRKID